MECAWYRRIDCRGRLPGILLGIIYTSYICESAVGRGAAPDNHLDSRPNRCVIEQRGPTNIDRLPRIGIWLIPPSGAIYLLRATTPDNHLVSGTIRQCDKPLERGR